MYDFSKTSPSGAPNPAPSTDKDCYRGRQGVKATTTPSVGFNNPNEGAMRALYHGKTMPVSDINGHAPTAQERGMPSDQARMGAGGIDYRKDGAGHDYVRKLSLKDAK